MSSSEEDSGGEDPKEEVCPAIVMLDEETGNKYMRIVGQKGLGAKGEMKWLVQDMHEELEAWGRPGGANQIVILKSDGEPAIVSVREALARIHGGMVTPEQPPRGEHQSNGAVEEAGRTLRDMLRVLKLQLEARIKQPLEVDSPVIQWLARWAAMILSRFKVGKDHRTAHERQRGKACRMEVVPFGEKVWFWPLVSKDGRKRSMQARWEEGVWLGHCRESTEVWIGHEGEAVRAWAVRRRVPRERWDAQAILALKAKPWVTTEGKIQGGAEAEIKKVIDWARRSLPLKRMRMASGT